MDTPILLRLLSLRGTRQKAHAEPLLQPVRQYTKRHGLHLPRSCFADPFDQNPALDKITSFEAPAAAAVQGNVLLSLLANGSNLGAGQDSRDGCAWLDVDNRWLDKVPDELSSRKSTSWFSVLRSSETR